MVYCSRTNVKNNNIVLYVFLTTYLIEYNLKVFTSVIYFIEYTVHNFWKCFLTLKNYYFQNL